MTLRVVRDIDWLVDDQTGIIQGYQRKDGSSSFLGGGQVVSGVWMKLPTVFRLQMTGTGSITMKARDGSSVITEDVFSTAVNNAVGEIAFPYAGDTAEEVCFTITGNLAVEVL